MVFFIGWELWEKMAFVLANLIALVLILGCSIQLHRTWKLRRYLKTTNGRRLAIEYIDPEKARTANDVPFGQRALDGGIEVEGIWISNPNSPIVTPKKGGTPSSSRRSSLAPNDLPSKVSGVNGGPPTPKRQASSRSAQQPQRSSSLHSELQQSPDTGPLQENLRRRMPSISESSHSPGILTVNDNINSDNNEMNNRFPNAKPQKVQRRSTTDPRQVIRPNGGTINKLGNGTQSLGGYGKVRAKTGQFNNAEPANEELQDQKKHSMTLRRKLMIFQRQVKLGDEQTASAS